VEAAAYFAVAEALTNAARHSGSDRAEVSLTRTGTGVRAVVRDAGKGGAVLSGDGTGGTGPSGMRRRVAALDGTFTVTSPVERGHGPLHQQPPRRRAKELAWKELPR
jgi:signal transduction histidine kinase